MESRVKILGHAVHQLLIVFPLGLLSGAVIFDVVWLLTKKPEMGLVCYWTMVAGIVGGLAAAPFGTIDWLAIPSGTPPSALVCCTESPPQRCWSFSAQVFGYGRGMKATTGSATYALLRASDSRFSSAGLEVSWSVDLESQCTMARTSIRQVPSAISRRRPMSMPFPRGCSASRPTTAAVARQSGKGL